MERAVGERLGETLGEVGGGLPRVAGGDAQHEHVGGADDDGFATGEVHDGGGCLVGVDDVERSA